MVLANRSTTLFASATYSNYLNYTVVMALKDTRPRSPQDLGMMKKSNSKVAWLTAYDYPSAYCSEKAGIDMLLVGDSGAMVQYGMPRTSGISMDLMIEMAKSVRIGAPKTLVVGDMPRGSYEISRESAVRNALRFAIEGSCDFIKLEGASSSILKSAEAIREAGVPVIGHLGLTPQSLGTVQAYKVAGKQEGEIRELKKNVSNLIDSGVSCILLEAIPSNVSAALRDISTVPIYGIGAGPFLDGQLLIYHDIVGYFPLFRPKFAHLFASEVLMNWTELSQPGDEADYMQGGIGQVVELSIKAYIDGVKRGLFPSDKFVYPPIDQQVVDSVFN